MIVHNRTCGRTSETLSPPNFRPGAGCNSESAHFGANGIFYSHICGRIVGYQVGSTDGFGPYTRSYYTRLEDPFIDGVILTHGNSIFGHLILCSRSIADD